MITENQRKEHEKRVKEIERFFKNNRKKFEILIFTTPDPEYHTRVSKIINRIKKGEVR